MAFSLRIKSYEQNFGIRGEDGVIYNIHEFIGADPILVARPSTPIILTQVGRCESYEGYLVPPAAVFPDQQVEQPELKRRRIIAGFLFEVEWTRVMAIDASELSAFDFVAAAKPPASPTFVDE